MNHTCPRLGPSAFPRLPGLLQPGLARPSPPAPERRRRPRAEPAAAPAAGRAGPGGAAPRVPQQPRAAGGPAVPASPVPCPPQLHRPRRRHRGPSGPLLSSLLPLRSFCRQAPPRAAKQRCRKGARRKAPRPPPLKRGP